MVVCAGRATSGKTKNFLVASGDLEDLPSARPSWPLGRSDRMIQGPKARSFNSQDSAGHSDRQFNGVCWSGSPTQLLENSMEGPTKEGLQGRIQDSRCCISTRIVPIVALGVQV